MLDYAPPGSLTNPEDALVIPPVWISVVGQQSLWPLEVRDVDTRDGDYTLHVLRSGLRGDDAGAVAPGETETSLLDVSRWQVVAVIVLWLVLVVHGIAYLSAVRPAGWADRLKHTPAVRILHLHRWPRALADVGLEHQLFVGLTLVLVWSTGLFVARLTGVWLEPPIGRETEGVAGSLAMFTDGWLDTGLFIVSIGFVISVGASTVLAMGARRPPPEDGPMTETAGTRVGKLLDRGLRLHGWILGCVSTAVVLFLGLRAVWYFQRFLNADVWDRPTDAVIAFARTANPANWISPLTPVLLIALVLYLWLTWHMRQLAIGGTSYRSGSQIFRILTVRDRGLAEDLRNVLVSAWRREHAGTLLIPVVALAAYGLYVPKWYTPDGQAFGSFLWWGSCLAVFVVAHVLAQTLHLWLLLMRVLGHLKRHRLSDVFGDVAKEPLNWSLSLTPPRLDELKLITRHARRLGQILEMVASKAPALPRTAWAGTDRRGTPQAGRDHAMSAELTGLAQALGTRAGDVRSLQHLMRTNPHGLLEAEIKRDRHRRFLESATWNCLVRLSDRLVALLRHACWHRRLDGVGAEARVWYKQAELVVGLQIAFIIRDVLSRIVSGMTVAILGGTLILASHLFYAWPGRAAMLAIDWGMLAVSVTIVGVMLVRLEKDAILSRLWATAEGRVSFTGGFFYRIALYGALPLLTLFVWQFPEVGGSVFSWLEPLRKAMP